jgi:cell division protein FtsL
MKDTIIDPEWETDREREEKIANNDAKTYDPQENLTEEPDGLSSIEEPDPFAEPDTDLGGCLGPLLSGNILSKAEVKRLYPLLLLVSFLAILYISNIFRIQSLYRQYNQLSREVKELQAESVTLASERINATRRNRIVEEANARGLNLRESVVPPKVVR